MRESGASLVPITAPQYPPLLREIYDPPVAVFVRGSLDLLATTMLGVVGTRRPTAYGTAVAEHLATDLARAGLTVVSGMARGIDTAAHKGALAAEGATVAVLGCGVDLVYPAENRKLAATIAEKGALISEFAMGTAAYPQNFPVRNRIVSGMSVGVLVVEGAQYSGSSITARLALDQGREVFAVPGNITSKVSWGPNLLIKQGAKLVQDWNDVVVELSPDIRRQLIEEGKRRLGVETSDDPEASVFAGPNGETARTVLGKLKVDAATHLDELMDQVDGISPSEVIAALFELEMMGLAKQMPGKNFLKVW
jgi:DNA processing protein